MTRYRQHQTTQAEVDSYRDATRERFVGFPFLIESNGSGLHVTCKLCPVSTTINPESFILNHAATHLVPLAP